MTFKVEPDHVDAYGRMVDRAQSNVNQGLQFLESKALVGDSALSELWGLIVGHHQDQVNQSKQAIKAFETALGACQAELTRTAQYYRTVDHEQVARIDATYPGGAGPPAGSYEGNGDFSDTVDATDGLSTPDPGFWESVRQGAEDRYQGLIGSRVDSVTGEGKNPALGLLGIGLDLVSPSTLVNEGIKLAFNFDLFGEAAQLIAGDWESYTTCSAAWGALGDLFRHVSTNVTHGNNLLSDSWWGNASETRWEYFQELAKKLNDTDSCFDQLRYAYEDVATAIAQFAEGVKAGLIFISDLAIAAAIEAAVAAGAAATGVGLVVTGGAAALIAAKVAMMIDKWADLIKALTVLYATVNAVFGAGSAALSGRLDAVKAFPLPGGGYDHQAV